MKAPSKYDQMRIMREANLQPRKEPTDERSVARKPDYRRRIPATLDPGPIAIPWLAPEGQCASCDKRRAQLQDTMKKRRAKAATVS